MILLCEILILALKALNLHPLKHKQLNINSPDVILFPLYCKFPANEDLRLKVVQAMKGDKLTPSKYSYICSAHFNVTDNADPPGQPYTKLKKSAVPSKFNFPCHFMPKTTPARMPIAYVKLPSNVANTSVSKRKRKPLMSNSILIV